jgi:aryl-alcohol dehydrogenase-like predicted oxidoreductase
MMQYGTVPGVGKPVARLVQGTVMLSSKQLEESFTLLDALFEQGGTTFDTAHGYGQGDCERVLGRWYNDRGLRDQVVVIAKGAHHNQDRQRVTPYDITADLHDSLARQKTDYFDIYLLHRDDPSQPVGPIVEILNEHQRAGKIHVFGGSNWSVARLQEANAYATAHGLQGFAASSPNFSLAVQAKPPWPNCISISGPQGADERAWYADNQMPLFTWSSLAGGFFSGRFNRTNLDSFESYGDTLCVETYCFEENFQRLDRVQALAEAKGMSLAQVATAYVMSVPLNIFALVGCRTGDEFRENVAASTLRLTPDEIDWLELRTAAAPDLSPV